MVRASPLSELARLGFDDLGASGERLTRLVAALGEPLAKEVTKRFHVAASPDHALRSLLEIWAGAADQLAKFLANPTATERLLRLLGASDALGEHLRRHPNQLSVFLADTTTPERLSVVASAPDAQDQLRIRYRHELLRIADWDLSQQSAVETVEVVGRRLAQLADDALEAALEIARVKLEKAGAFAPSAIADARLAVIAMGKCGAQELNYLSDIDVIFVGSESDSSLRISTRLATQMMRVLDEPALEPPLWTVDPNLRPEGKSGALVRSLESHEAYFEKWAENWEYQAQLKARFAAGDVELGTAYIERVSQRVWAKDGRSDLVETVRKMRKRVLDNIPEALQDREIKLGLGGLRDVEFTVQLLQLVHGVADPGVRVADTLGAISALSNAGFIGRESASELANCYGTLRAIEHRVQLQNLERDHLFPEKATNQRRVARSIPEFANADALLAGWQQTKQRVMQLTQDIFYRPLLNAIANLTPEDVSLSDEQVEARLRAIGFADAAGALRHISALTQGVSRSAQMQRNLLPVFLRWLGEGAFPDRGLLAFRRLSESLGDSHWFLRMLRDQSGAAQGLARVISSGSYIADLLEQIPESAAWFAGDEHLAPRNSAELAAELGALIERNGDAPAAVDAVQWVRRREVLRAAIRTALDGIELDTLMITLSDLTDAYLKANLKIAMREVAAPEGFQIAVIGMGRLGARELTLASDADVMLVYDSQDAGSAELADRIAGEFIGNCQDLRLLFELDLELRPEGKKGSRIRSLESYQSYYSRWAEEWEFQALLKARFVAGSTQLGERFIQLADQHRYGHQLSEEQFKRIRLIKARVEAERLPKGADPARHLKLGRGGISDVEWLVQLEQLKLAGTQVELRIQSTLKTLELVGQLGVLPDSAARALETAWRMASRIRTAIALVLGKSGDQLPTDRSQLAAIAQLLQRESPSVLENEYLGAARRARRIFEDNFFGGVAE